MMLEFIVESLIDELYKNMVQGKFYIGLDSIKQYIRFYITAEYMQKHVLNEEISIHRYCEEHIPPNPLDKDGKFWWSEYERTLDHYNSLNFEKKIQLHMRQKNEAQAREQNTDKNISGRAERYKGISLKRHELAEFGMLNAIKENSDSHMQGPNKTYKRINSDKGYLHLLNYTQYADFVLFLKQDIELSNSYQYPNMHYYFIERKLNYELTKAILTALHQCCESNRQEDAVLDDLILLYCLPVIDKRQEYASVYPKLNQDEREKWRLEITSLYSFISMCISIVQEYVKNYKPETIFNPLEIEFFKTIYLPPSYSNDFEISKDFDDSDFSKLMNTLDKLNRELIDLASQLDII